MNLERVRYLFALDKPSSPPEAWTLPFSRGRTSVQVISGEEWIPGGRTLSWPVGDQSGLLNYMLLVFLSCRDCQPGFCLSLAEAIVDFNVLDRMMQGKEENRKS